MLLTVFISVYNICTLLSNNEKYIGANLNAPDNAISDKGICLSVCLYMAEMCFTHCIHFKG